ncbi:MAG: carboxypeptidase-like regulatory domain-containing protein [Bacteroidetes bacterium]|nr:carboxypeptidase-like regulatory domain-containing protein [Bacteroidota bacterium]
MPFVKARLSGQITDAGGKPLPFASLQLSPGSVGTMSNEQGRFEVELDTGTYRIQIHFLGYEPKIASIYIGMQGLQTQFVLKPQVFNLQEVKVKAGAEDPAYALMRRAIRHAPLHIQALQSYTAQSYVKGTFRIISAPYLMRKAIEKENFKVGTTYVLESLSDLRYKAPAAFTEQVRSLRSSLPPGTENQIRYTQFNLYRPRNGEIISPLAPNSFTHYRFRYRGESRQGEQVIHRIEVEPRSKLPFHFKGDLYLREPNMGIYATNLSFTDDNGISYSVNQQYQPVQGWWMPSTQEIKLKATFLGVTGDMRYVTSLRQYRLQVDTLVFQRITGDGKRIEDKKRDESVGGKANRQTQRAVRKIIQQLNDTANSGSVDSEEEGITGRDYTYKIDSNASRSPDSLWAQMRLLPLEVEEVTAYKMADSLYEIQYDKWQRDSLKELPRFRWHQVFTGHEYRLGKRTEDGLYPQQWELRGLLSGLFRGDIFNTVEGWVLKSSISYSDNRVRDNEHTTRADLRYSFGRDRLLLYAGHTHKFGEHSIRVSGGRKVTQYNANEPVSPSTNLTRTLLDGKNLLNLYDLTAFEARVSIRAHPDWKWNIRSAWHRRSPLENLSQLPAYMIRGGIAPNHPKNNERPGQTKFTAHDALLLDLEVLWIPGTRLSRYNGRTRWESSGLPQFSSGIRSGKIIAGWPFDSLIGTNFGRSFAEVYSGMRWSPNVSGGRSLQLQLDGGTFLITPAQLIDFRHFNGLLSRIQTRGDNRFRDLDIYAHSTSGPWATGFMRFSTGRMLLNRIEALRRIGLGEEVFVSGLITDRIRHLELGYSLLTPFEAIGIDGFISFDSLKRRNIGYRILIGF